MSRIGDRLQPPLSDGQDRFTFEIDEQEVASRRQHLAEVQVAVHADAHPTRRGQQPSQPVEQLVRVVDDEVRIGRAHARELGLRLLDRPERSRCGVAHRLVRRSCASAVEQLGRERRIVGRGEREMELGGAPPEKLHRRQDATGQCLEFARRLPVEHVQRVERRGALAHGVFVRATEHAVVETPDGVAVPRVCVALVRLVRVRDGDRRRWRSRAPVLDGAQQRRRVRKPPLVGQHASDLDLGADAGLDPAHGLHDHVFVERQRRVRLLSTEHRHRKVGLLRDAPLRDRRPVGDAGQRARFAFHTPAPLHQLHERAAVAREPVRVDEDPGFVRGIAPYACEGGGRLLLGEALTRAPGHERHRQEVCVWLAFAIVDDGRTRRGGVPAGHLLAVCPHMGKRELDPVDDTRSRHGPALGTEPTTRLQHPRQSLVELRTDVAVEQLRPGAGHVQHGQLAVGGVLGARGARAPASRRRAVRA